MMTTAGVMGTARGLVDECMSQFRRVEVLDRSYTIAASAFVALLPLVILIVGVLSAGDYTVIADGMVTRLGLQGVAERAVRQLLSGGSPGLYPIGLIIVLYSAFSLSRRVGRAYATIWEVPQLPLRAQWRGLVWVALQVVVVMSVASLREAAAAGGVVAGVVAYALAVVCWYLAELAAQWLLTMGQVPWRRVRVAALLVSVGRLGVAVWAQVYLTPALTRQAEQYGPIGVVFSLFTLIFAGSLVLLVGTMLGAVLTSDEPAGAETSSSAPDPV